MSIGLYIYRWLTWKMNLVSRRFNNRGERYGLGQLTNTRSYPENFRITCWGKERG